MPERTVAPARKVCALLSVVTLLGSLCAARTQDAAPAAASEVWKLTLPGDLVGIELQAIPGGTLERDGNKIEIAPFWMARTELTWDAYDVLVFRLDLPEEQRVLDIDGVTRPTKPYIMVDRGFGHAGYPALSMSQLAAESFCAWLSAATGRKFRLPTVDEWEYAARAGSPTPFSCGGPEALDAYAWYRDNAARKTQPVARKLANAFGLFDMHGNVSEWAVGPDGKGVQCGGTFRDSAVKIGADARREPTSSWNASDPQMPKSVWWLADANFVGFRVVCEPQEPKPNSSGD